MMYAPNWRRSCKSRKQSNSQMTVERNHAIAIAALRWLAKKSRPKRESNLIAPYTRDFSRALSKWQVIAANSDWFIALFAPVVIGRSNYFAIGFRDSNLETTIKPKKQNEGLLTRSPWGPGSPGVPVQPLSPFSPTGPTSPFCPLGPWSPWK